MKSTAETGIVRRLARWYGGNARKLPWRQERDPYAIWVSEIMLQQTQVATVIAYWLAWMRQFPTIESLAGASESEVLAAWQGLGYYSRARNLQKAARIIVAEHGGKFPTAVEEIRELPGIGRYTAGAIASIAFEKPEPILDGNIIRVLARFYAIRESVDLAGTRNRLWELSGAWLQSAARLGIPPGDFNQSMMELGALVCLPQPRCGDCPVRRHCAARKLGLATKIPNKPGKGSIREIRAKASLFLCSGKILLVQRTAPGANRGFWEAPLHLRHEKPPESPAVRLLSSTAMPRVRHSIMNTRWEITPTVLRVRRAFAVPGKTYRWIELTELKKIPVTTITRKILAAMPRNRSVPKSRKRRQRVPLG